MAQAAALEQAVPPGAGRPSPAAPTSNHRRRGTSSTAAAAAATGGGGGSSSSAARRRRSTDVIDLLGLDSDSDGDDIQVVAVRQPVAPPPPPPLAAAGPGSSHGDRKRSRAAAGGAGGGSPAAAAAAGGRGGLSWDAPAAAPEREPSPEPAFKCAICLEAITNMASTPCGHVFCYECLRDCVKVHKKCPKCRKGVQLKQIHRIYLN